MSNSPSYSLHVLEFDDQGWTYPLAVAESSKIIPDQIDCAISDIAHQAEQGKIFVLTYVHGWHHSADPKDEDFIRFQEAVKRRAESDPTRRVIGVYIGWTGDTWNLPMVNLLTFWARKNAALHVAEGSIREYFSRFRALRNYYNRPKRIEDSEDKQRCGKGEVGTRDGCPIQAVMIGHSFGAWILYASTAPYVLETLASTTDLPAAAIPPITERERGIADLIILLNPAFEASRYEPVFRAARRYESHRYEPPLLVSITSTADRATKNVFPIARWINTIFQYPTSSDDESIAIKRTPGHTDRYITHQLVVSKANDGSSGRDDACSDDDEKKLRREFFQSATGNERRLKLRSDWYRKFCPGLRLESIKSLPDGSGNTIDPYGIVWNIQTNRDIVSGHNDIYSPLLTHFMRQLSGDISDSPRMLIDRE